MNIFNWFVDQWSGETFSNGSWYNITALVFMILVVFLGLAFIAQALIDGDKSVARWALFILFVGPLLVLIWPVSLFAGVIYLIYTVISLAW